MSPISRRFPDGAAPLGSLGRVEVPVGSGEDVLRPLDAGPRCGDADGDRQREIPEGPREASLEEQRPIPTEVSVQQVRLDEVVKELLAGWASRLGYDGHRLLLEELGVPGLSVLR